MTEDEILKFEKIITINDESQEIYTKCMLFLLNCMYESNKLNKVYLTYFRIRTKDSEKTMNSKDIVLEWHAKNSIELNWMKQNDSNNFG
jgi:hypothetical protein